MHHACPWSEHQHMKSSRDEAERLESEFTVVLACVFNNQRTRPLKVDCSFEREATFGDIPLVLFRVETDVHLFIVCSYIR